MFVSAETGLRLDSNALSEEGGGDGKPNFALPIPAQVEDKKQVETI